MCQQLAHVTFGLLHEMPWEGCSDCWKDLIAQKKPLLVHGMVLSILNISFAHLDYMLYSSRLNYSR